MSKRITHFPLWNNKLVDVKDSLKYQDSVRWAGLRACGLGSSFDSFPKGSKKEEMGSICLTSVLGLKKKVRNTQSLYCPKQFCRAKII